MNIDLLDEPLIRSLLDENISFYEVMNTYSIKTQVALNLRAHIKGFIYVSKRGNYHIILNGKICYKEQCRTLIHEIKHIMQDIPRFSYYVGINMQHCTVENDAEIFDILKDII